MKGKKTNLFINGIILTVTALIMRSVSVAFKVYTSNEIGAEGMGVYKLITTVYMLATTLALSGISVAVTRVVSEEIGKKSYENVKSVLIKSCVISLGLSSIVCLLLLIASEPIGIYFLKDERTVLAIRVVSLSLPFVAISSCIKGYYYALRDVIIPVTSQIIEQAIKITIVVILLNSAMVKGLQYGCGVLVLGTTISEFISCLYVVFIYKIDSIKGLKGGVTNTEGLVKRLFSIALPIAGNSYLNSILRTVETMLIPVGLMKFGMSPKESMSVLGGLMGMLMPIIMYPASLLMSMGALLIPEVSRAKGAKNDERVDSLVSRAINLTSIVGIIAFFIFNTFNNELGLAIYNNSEIGKMFKLFSYIIPFMYMRMVTDSLLRGLNEQVATLKYSLLDSVLRIALIYVLLPIKGLDGFLMTMFFSTALSFILSFIRVLHVTRVRFNIINWILKPVLAGTITTLIVSVIRLSLVQNNFSITLMVTIIIVTMIIIYTGILGLMKGIKIKG